MSDYLTTADILGIHHILLEKYGGLGGIRDLGALESAVFRPQCGYYEDILDKTAALMESLLINHPFIDGNKRVAFAACDVFLRINGYQLTASADWIFERMMAWLADNNNRLALMRQDLEGKITQPGTNQ